MTRRAKLACPYLGGRNSTHAADFLPYFRPVIVIAAVLIGVGVPAVSIGQPTNMELFQVMTAKCLQPVADTLDAVVLDSDPRMSYADAILVSTLRDTGVAVYRSDSVGVAPHPRLRYRIDKASVRYDRGGGGAIARSAETAIRFELSLARGNIVANSSCHESSADLIQRSDVAAVESDLFPETKAELPRGRWTKRYLEPAVITAASAVGVYLLFSLRSKKNDS